VASADRTQADLLSLRKSGTQVGLRESGTQVGLRGSNTQALGELAAEPHRFTLFAALRLLEQVYVTQPRLGESRKAVDDRVRLGQTPHLTFAPADVRTFEPPGPGYARLEQYSFGAFGPNGALPHHLTEHAFEWRHHREDATLVDFMNLFQHRLVALFYRAWANSDPATSFDRPETDRFTQYVGALIGLAPQSARSGDSVSDRAKFNRAGRFAPQVRSAEGLEAVLCDYFELPFEVRPFVGDWLPIPRELGCRLGARREMALLGATATLGSASWQCHHKFEIAIGPLTLRNFLNFLPGARGLMELHALVRLYTNDEWDWQLRLLLREVEVPGIRIGQGARLGWTTWLGGRHATAGDVVIQESVAAGAEAALRVQAAA